MRFDPERLLALKNTPPNIVLIVADGLRWSDLCCLRNCLPGNPASRIDRLAAQGIRLKNYGVEADGILTRSALMTGRHPRQRCGRSLSIEGLGAAKATLAERLSAQGYATGHFGKWQLGEGPGQLPTDRGFDEWFGIPRSADQGRFVPGIEFEALAAAPATVMSGGKGRRSLNLKFYDAQAHRQFGAELVERATNFMRRQHRAGRPFFLYLPLAHLWFPTLPHPDFAGRSGKGDHADCLLEMDHRVGQVSDQIEALDITAETLVVFCSDGAAAHHTFLGDIARRWLDISGAAMQWRDSRAPCILRWPGTIAPGAATNEIVDVTDLFATLCAAGGIRLPSSRAIDGIDQLPLLTGLWSKSAREEVTLGCGHGFGVDEECVDTLHAT